jgi:hypothetical protein
MEQNKTGSSTEAPAKVGKYLKYAIGEIVLVVVGILIALSINNWNENQKKAKIKQSYIKNLITDITKDTIQLNDRLNLNHEYLASIDSSFAVINDSTLEIRAIFNYVKANNLSGLRVTNNYNNNTFNILISSGNIDLFSNAFTDDIMELNRLQNTEIIVSDGNSDFYFETVNNFRSLYFESNSITNQNLIDLLWENKDPKHVISLYINMKSQQRHTVRRYIELTKLVLKKSETVLDQLRINSNL